MSSHRMGWFSARGVALIGASVALAAMAAATASTAMASVLPHGPVSAGWGWATVRNASASYTPAAKDQGNSTGGTNAVTHMAAGLYRVDMPGIGVYAGVPQVSTLGNASHACSVDAWSPNGGIESIYVGCYSRTGGAFADATFTVEYLVTAGDAGPLAYLYANSPTTANYPAEAPYSINSAGGTNSIHRNGPGSYTVTIGGIHATGGNAQVSAAGQYGFVCNVASVAVQSTSTKIGVICRNSSGAATDTTFTLVYTKGEGLKGHGQGKVTYLVGNQPTAHSYAPASSTRFATPAGTPKITRASTGVYNVTLPSMPEGGAAFVSAFGTSDKIRCTIGSIRTTSTPQQVQVRCTTFAGVAKDAKFTLSYED
jgi:hypothetical protein